MGQYLSENDPSYVELDWEMMGFPRSYSEPKVRNEGRSVVQQGQTAAKGEAPQGRTIVADGPEKKASLEGKSRGETGGLKSVEYGIARSPKKGSEEMYDADCGL